MKIILYQVVMMEALDYGRKHKKIVGFQSRLLFINKEFKEYYLIR